MNTHNNLIKLTSDEPCPFLFFDNSKPRTYKIYHDGSHYVGMLCIRSKLKHKSGIRVRFKMDAVFDGFFHQAVQSGIKIKTANIKKFTDYIKPLMSQQVIGC